MCPDQHFMAPAMIAVGGTPGPSETQRFTRIEDVITLFIIIQQSGMIWFK